MGILSWKFRIVLFLGSVVVFLLIARFVRKQRIQVKDGIFWILFSVILIIFSIFPLLFFVLYYLPINSILSMVVLFAELVQLAPILFFVITVQGLLLPVLAYWSFLVK